MKNEWKTSSSFETKSVLARFKKKSILQYDHAFEVVRLEKVMGSETGKRWVTCTFSRAAAVLRLPLILYTRWAAVSVCGFTSTYQMRAAFLLWLNKLPIECIPVAFVAGCICFSAYLVVANEQGRVSCWRSQFGNYQTSLFLTFDVNSITVVCWFISFKHWVCDLWRRQHGFLLITCFNGF